VKGRFAYALPFGAEARRDGATHFRIWAPSVSEVALQIEGHSPAPMHRDRSGWFSTTVLCSPGAHYKFCLPDGTAVPDPAAREQVEDVHGFSKVVDPTSYFWRHESWRGRPWHEAVVYEIHVGTIGGFRSLSRLLPRLSHLGVTAVELLPIAEFPGPRNWGYDGVLPFAPDAAYGTPADLKMLVDTAHGLGLMVILDVVYNHFGPDGNFLQQYAAPFFRQDKKTPWGDAIDFNIPEVREFYFHNAQYWLMEYRFDGLRLDAAHAISNRQFLTDLATSIRQTVEPDRHVHLILENEENDSALLEHCYNAQWNDDMHHCLHVLLTGEIDAYYADFAISPAQLLARCLASGFAYQGEMSAHRGAPRGSPSDHLPPTAFIVCLQNHDQIGNRAFGERLTQLANPLALRAAITLLLLVPMIPLLFMGEEYGSREPFLFFTSHTGRLAEQVREGRRREFAHFSAFANPDNLVRIPDPNQSATFEASIPKLIGPDNPESVSTYALYQSLLKVRHKHIIPRIPGTTNLSAKAIAPAAVAARWRMGDGFALYLATNLGEEPVLIEPFAGASLFESCPTAIDQARSGILAPLATVAFLERPPHDG